MSQPCTPPNERRILRLDEVEAKSGFKRAHLQPDEEAPVPCRRCAWACALSAGIRSKSTEWDRRVKRRTKNGEDKGFNACHGRYNP